MCFLSPVKLVFWRFGYFRLMESINSGVLAYLIPVKELDNALRLHNASFTDNPDTLSAPVLPQATGE